MSEKVTDHITIIFKDNFSRKTEILQVISLGEDMNMYFQGVTRVLYNIFHNG